MALSELVTVKSAAQIIETYHKTPTTSNATASSEIFVCQIFSRETGCASNDANVPELTSTPNESSAIITATAGQITDGSIANMPVMSVLFSQSKSQFEKVTAQPMRKLGSSSRISFLRSAFMMASGKNWRSCAGSRRVPSP